MERDRGGQGGTALLGGLLGPDPGEAQRGAAAGMHCQRGGSRRRFVRTTGSPKQMRGSSRIRRLAYPRWPPWWPWSAPGGDLAPLTASLPAAAPVPRTSPRLFSSPRPCSRTGCSSWSILPENSGRVSLPAAQCLSNGGPASAAGRHHLRLAYCGPGRADDATIDRGTTRPRRDVSAAEERVSADHLALASPTLP